jgi:hypothetical protein
MMPNIRLFWVEDEGDDLAHYQGNFEVYMLDPSEMRV